MTNVFFRCLLARTSLMILLFPNIALECKDKNLNMAEVMRDFQYIIFYDFQHLFTCLDSKGYNSSGRNPQKSKHSLCPNGMEINSVHHLTCSIVHITKQVNFEFAQEIMALSRKTESALNCRCRNQKRHRTNNKKSKTSTRRKTKALRKQFSHNGFFDFHWHNFGPHVDKQQ
ncbi:uncharacterized protein LOC144592924 isoform X2 [Rhinoraja longicauda]